MNSNPNEVRPEEGTQKTDPRQGKARKVLSWLKSCESEETLTTLNTHSRKELEQVLTLCDKIKNKANEALDNVAERELEIALKEQKDAQTALELKNKEVETLKALVEAKRKSAAQQ